MEYISSMSEPRFPCCATESVTPARSASFPRFRSMGRSSENKLGLGGVSHVSLGTRDLVTAEYFYIDILGGTRVFDFENALTGERYGSFISLGNGTILELFHPTRR